MQDGHCYAIALSITRLQFTPRGALFPLSEGPSTRRTIKTIRARALKSPSGLTKGTASRSAPGDNLGRNTWRQLEAWYGSLGIGAIYHTINPRAFRTNHLM